MRVCVRSFGQVLCGFWAGFGRVLGESFERVFLLSESLFRFWTGAGAGAGAGGLRLGLGRGWGWGWAAVWGWGWGARRQLVCFEIFNMIQPLWMNLLKLCLSAV